MKKDPLIGQRLANFLVDKPLGRGGMAQVYYGIDTSLERPVAIKVIDARYQGDPEYARRFVDEAKLIARWRHENIVQVFYAGNEGDLYFFAMEFIDGMSLENLMERYIEEGGLMPHEDVLRIGRAIASALDYAHKQGVVHRDIKPSNVMISRDDRVVLMDFGLALDMGQGSMGQVFGTPHYISPEQAQKSSDATGQSDIYSFGVVLYEMLVGAIPFDDPSATSVAVQHITQEPPPPSLLNPALNYDIEKVLLKALAKAPQDRYKTATALLDALAAAMATLKNDVSDTSIMPPAAMSGKGPRLSRMSISEMMALDLDADMDEPDTVKSMRAINPVHRLETQETTVPPQATQIARQNKTREVIAAQETIPAPPPEASEPAQSKTGLLVALGAALIVVLLVVVVMLMMNIGAAPVDTAATETEAALSANTTPIAPTDSEATATEEPTEDVFGTATALVEAQQPTFIAQTELAANANGGTATTIAGTNAAINATNTSVALTNDALLAQQTAGAGSAQTQAADNANAQTQAADNALATNNAVMQATLTAQVLPTDAPQATSPAFAGGLLLEMSYNGAGFYLRNASDTNLRLSTLSFSALDANGNAVGNNFSGGDWSVNYHTVERNGACASIELLDIGNWNRPGNCVRYNSQLTFPTNDQRIFWDGRNGATQFAVIWNGTEAGRCAIVDGFCSILVGR